LGKIQDDIRRGDAKGGPERQLFRALRREGHHPGVRDLGTAAYEQALPRKKRKFQI
jgi:hypothetical protein